MSKGTMEITPKVVAGLMVKGAQEVYAEANGLFEKAIKEKGQGQALAFPETAFYLPLANALLGVEVKKIADAKKILATAGTLIVKVPPEDKWDTFLKDALNAGVATILSEEVIASLRYLYGKEPQADCPGFFSDTLLRSLGIQLVDGRISGIGVVLGKAPDNATAVNIIRDLQKRNILTLVGGSVDGRSIIDQLKDGGLQMGLDSYVVPYGRDTISVVFVLNFAIRAALTFGGIKAGNTQACVDYVKNRVPAFVLLLGGVDEVKAATGAGALAAGVPIITDLDLPEIRVPGVCAHEECLVSEKDHKKIVQKAIETRGIKIKITQVPIPVPFSAAFEGERVRKADMYVQFGGKYSTAFEYLKMKRMNEIEDGKIDIIGPDIDSGQSAGSQSKTSSATTGGHGIFPSPNRNAIVVSPPTFTTFVARRPISTSFIELTNLSLTSSTGIISFQHPFENFAYRLTDVRAFKIQYRLIGNIPFDQILIIWNGP